MQNHCPRGYLEDINRKPLCIFWHIHGVVNNGNEPEKMSIVYICKTAFLCEYLKLILNVIRKRIRRTYFEMPVGVND